ncbi:ATP-binding cassette domain-containing protein [Egibacter rhizosphaerae]|uniref:ATP-binding cassette domain-containing protein n=1 Tax=Egibacter rhizosphaerae TaxID=1670831 RepID=UPI00197AA91C|nr:excinuclease ABC subunit UvrA [Egibacter rhizosphaerae]
MYPDAIRVTGARQHNLKSVDVEIPKGQFTVVTGVSGSGKSSLVFDTIAAEAQRQLNETFSAFQRGFLPSYGQPDADLIEHLSPAIVVDQKRLGGGSRSTLGTISDIAPLLRLLFSRAGEPWVGYAHTFSFNDPEGMCPRCQGLGDVVDVDLDAFVDWSRSLNEGALRHPNFKVGTWMWQVYANSGRFDPDKPLAEYTDAECHDLLFATEGRVPIGDGPAQVNASYEGAATKFRRLSIERDVAEMSERTREIAARFTTSRSCPACEGARLNDTVLGCRVHGYNIAEMAAMEARELHMLLDELDLPGAGPVAGHLRERVGHLVDMGLGYLSLDRRTATLSGGESQRIKMVRHLTSSLTDMLYVFDEPTVGLHARDVDRFVALLLELRDKGNTVLVVEHDRDVITAADHVVDIGPGAGIDGGEVVFTGAVAALATAATPTGEHVRRLPTLRQDPREPAGVLEIRNAYQHNLRGLDLDLPAGTLTVVSGVAGSGKSSLVHGAFVAGHTDAIVVDQTAVSTNRRSNTATYTGMLDPIRKAFARANGVSASLFSANSTGACPSCQGLGVIYTDLAFLEGFTSTCDACGGQRFTDDVLAHRLRGASIGDVLEMTAGVALDFFTVERKVQTILGAIVDVGLDYLRLGQPLTTLSGGECQRIKLAAQLHREGAVYVLDEPTTGLHASDIDTLLAVLDRLVDGGNTVLVIEHDLQVIAHADWVVDLGPEGGDDGGAVLFEGPPTDLLRASGSHTAAALRRAVDRS